MSHSHLTLEERIVIELFVHMGLSCRKIATYLGRSHTSVCRELCRNSFPKVATPTRQQSAAPRKDVQCPEKTYNAVAMAGSHNGHAKNRKAAPIQ